MSHIHAAAASYCAFSPSVLSNSVKGSARELRAPVACFPGADKKPPTGRNEKDEVFSEPKLQASTDLTRRALMLAAAAAAQLMIGKNSKAETTLVEPSLLELIPYDDEQEGFTLLRPANWNKVDKAGATLLFQDPEQKSSTIGVVVNKVRIPTLREFGSLEDVTNRLIAAERRKESTREATLLRSTSREVRGGIPLYTMEYFLDSTRGTKRTLTAVTIASNKLYILNIAYSDSQGNPAPPSLTEPLHQVLESFDLLG